MRLAGRVSAAIEILDEIFARHRPAADALRDWGKTHRFAGAADRHAIGSLVFDALRTRNSSAFRADNDGGRGIVLGVLVAQWKLTLAELEQLTSEQHGPAALSPSERRALTRDLPPDPPLHIAGDLPEWIAAMFVQQFGPMALDEARGLARRAPIDLRVNKIKASKPQVMKALERFAPVDTPLSPDGVRIAAPGPERKHVNVEAEPSHGMGWFEIQDAASQVAALMTGACAGEHVADICAGGGGKTLALASMMNNQGRILAYDRDRHRLRPIFERLTRAGASCVEVIAAENAAALDAAGGFDCVLIDAPCSGSGSWRRKPDAKWRLTRKALDTRLQEQKDVLKRGAALVRPGGRLVYVTCSMLREENESQVAGFLQGNSGFKVIPFAEQWRRAIRTEPPQSAMAGEEGLLLTPRQHDVDGFYLCVMRKVA